MRSTRLLEFEKLHDVLELRLTRGGDTFQALDKSEPVAVPDGEWPTSRTDRADRHVVWRQSRAGIITPETIVAGR